MFTVCTVTFCCVVRKDHHADTRDWTLAAHHCHLEAATWFWESKVPVLIADLALFCVGLGIWQVLRHLLSLQLFNFAAPEKMLVSHSCRFRVPDFET